MELYERAPIILREDEKHSHKPNTSRRDRMWFLHHLTSRNRAEDTPFSVIFQEEAAKLVDPLSTYYRVATVKISLRIY